jgi:hypothetical protein
VSTHQDAIVAAWDATGLDIVDVVECVQRFLVALPPSIVVDGKVVELDKVVAKYCSSVTHELPNEVYEGSILQSWLDAAREVAS